MNDSESDTVDEFFDDVIIDMGYVSLPGWEIVGVDENEETITFGKED